MNKDEAIEIITDDNHKFIEVFNEKRRFIRKKEFDHYRRFNEFVFSSTLIQSIKNKFVLFYIGCTAKSPYTKIAFLTVSRDSSIYEYDCFKDERKYGYFAFESFRFAYSIDRSDEAKSLTKDFISSLEADNLSYIENLSERLVSEIIDKESKSKYLGVDPKRVEYVDNNFNEKRDNLSIDFAKSIITGENNELKEIGIDNFLREKNELVFISKKFIFDNEIMKHLVILNVGRSKKNPEDQYIVFKILKSDSENDKNPILFMSSFKDLYDDTLYSDKLNQVMYSDLNDRVKKEAEEMAKYVTIKDASKEKMYALYKRTVAGHYESGSSDHEYILAMSNDKDSLVSRYNLSIENKSLPKITGNNYSVSFNGNTGGGCSSVSHTVEIREFRDFDMPTLEK